MDSKQRSGTLVLTKKKPRGSKPRGSSHRQVANLSTGTLLIANPAWRFLRACRTFRRIREAYSVSNATPHRSADAWGLRRCLDSPQRAMVTIHHQRTRRQVRIGFRSKACSKTHLFTSHDEAEVRTTAPLSFTSTNKTVSSPLPGLMKDVS